ncbi:oligopeptide transporter [Xylariaceae sp. FL0016]|nr:oligopeptide transporter [Xylariaceae sp. FL0016]
MSSSHQSHNPLGQSPAVVPSEKNQHPTECVSSRPDPDAPQLSIPRQATSDDLAKLRHVSEAVPAVVWLVAFTGAAQRLAFYGTTVPWQNYLQNEPGNSASPGVLGLGQSTATIMNSAFLFFSYLTPLPFAIISDSLLGRYKTLLLSLIIFVLGEIVLFITALPFAVREKGTALGGFITALVLIGLGQGGTSAVIFPFLCDQIPDKKPQVFRDKKGETVVSDSKLTVQYVFNAFYWMINVAALVTLATTNMEKRVGFWAAYLLPLCCLTTAMIPFLLWNARFTKLSPQGNVLPNAARVLSISIKSGFHLSEADPVQPRAHLERTVPWTSTFVQEIRRGLRACRVVICFTIFYLCFNQTTTNIISQANQMEISGISNDTIQSLNAIFYILLNPMIQNVLFPFLSQRRISFGPIARMTAAFFFMAAAMAYAAGIQKLIYDSPPCYSQPLHCQASTISISDDEIRYRPNEVSIWLQVPLQMLLAVGEIFGFVALNEFAYTEAPTNMKALVKAFEQLTAALGAALGVALGPVSKDPWLVIMYSSLAGTMVVSGAAFYAVFRGHDANWHTKKGIDESESSEDGAETSGNGQSSTRIS